MCASRAAGRRTAGRMRRLFRPHEGTDEFAVNFGSDCAHIDSLGGQECASIFEVVDPSWFNSNRFKASFCQLGNVFIVSKSTRDTANPEQHAFPQVIGNMTAHNHV